MSARVAPAIDFRALVARGGSLHCAFEEYCCHLARRVEGGGLCRFERLRGDGGDGGVECVWHLEDGGEWGWQAKYVFDLSPALRQLDKSLARALDVHPRLERYFVCLPFDLTGPRGGAGRDERARFEAFVSEWEAEAARRGMTLSIELWDASELASRLLAVDPDGGRRRYWFDSNVLGDAWFDRHLTGLPDLAGPRYSPELHFGHALSGVLGALGGLPEWKQQLADRSHRLREAREEWTRGLAIRDEARGDPAFPPACRGIGQQLADELEVLEGHLRGAASGLSPPELLDEAARVAARCIDALSEDLDDRFGAGTAGSAHWRQHWVEIEATWSSPAVYLDRARDVATLLDELRAWLRGPEPAAFDSGVLVIIGPAGIGKTHGACDAAVQRGTRGLKSVVLFGQRFTDSHPAWVQVRDQLGLDGGLSSDALFDLLDCAAEASGAPLIVFVDALNETVPRAFWRRELPALLREVRQRENLRVCLTCRTPYLQQILPEGVQLPTFEHPGFAGEEFDACTAFFEHYGLEPPTGPLLHPEFSNPLFLQLVCRALVLRGEKRIPRGWTGVQQVLRALLDHFDAAVFAELEGGDRHPVTRAMETLATELARRGTSTLPWSEASEFVARRLPPAQRHRFDLLDRLLADGLFWRTPAVQGGTSLAPPEDHVAIAFERLGDHLQARVLLDSISDPDRLDADSVERLESAAREPGLAQTLSVLVPERWTGVELLDLVPGIGGAAMPSWLESLPWRAPGSLTTRTETQLRRALSIGETIDQALDAALALAMGPRSRLDVRWLHQLLAQRPMAERDAVLCSYLHDRFAESPQTSPVLRLLEAAWSDSARRIDAELAERWITVLCWFFAAADRRVRDQATKAAVRLGEIHPATWEPVLSRFLDVDDDSIVERCLAGAYGSLMRNPDRRTLENLAGILHERVFRDGARHHANALVRDHGRCIAELAAERQALPPHLSLDSFRPPYQSDWPLAVPTEGDLEPYRTPESLRRYPRLYQSCVDYWGGDFASYTVPDALGGREHAFPVESARRWIFGHVLELGYTPERFARYDHEMLRRYGGGRGKPKWAERIGKKYQLIALSRLAARLRDNLPWRGGEAEELPSEHELQGENLRDIDPSLLVKSSSSERATSWWMPVEYDFAGTEAVPGPVWVGLDDFPDSSAILTPRPDPADPSRRWRLLTGFLRWREHETTDWKTPSRDIWMLISGYLLPRRSLRRCWARLRTLDFYGRWMPKGWGCPGHGFVGEYPWAPSFRETRDHRTRPHERLPFPLEPVANTLNSSFEADAWSGGPINIHVPSLDLVRWTSTRWSPDAGFKDPQGRVVFLDPSVEEPGPGCLLVDEERLQGLLADRKLVLVWTVLAERSVLGSRDEEFAGAKHISRVHRLDGDKVRSSARPVGEHVNGQRERRTL